MIDHAVAERVGIAATRPGPALSLGEAADAVGALRSASRRAVGYVAEVTGFDDAAERAATVPVFVVDRSGFIRANVQMVDAMVGDGFDAGVTGADRRATATGLGVALAVLASRVLGQFDPFGTPTDDGAAPFPSRPAASEAPDGRLLLVAPNVVAVERAMGVTPADFRLWVGLHEMTHAVQFAAAPWLAEHLAGMLRQVIADESAMSGTEDLIRMVGAVARTAWGRPGASIALDALPEPARLVMERTTAVMSLLEGHADVVMDAVGPDIIPSLAAIRAKFNARRRGRSGLDRLVRRLAGLDAKTSQYVQGAGFVRTVLDVAGRDGIAAAFATEDNLPTPAEIANPAAWVARVLA
ncbi:MAG: zinc-dependent metalloprotease [Bifidobacteriaceae bacterium]|jgi:coenzyme F420 biosynthesis associated uncharacterized protein|nr:zinc-dependent metalloprotease [Bifidobacteriaceae bacterium]